jgi:hypothetical protein
VAGEDLPNGKLAEQNYVWLSEWQIENLNERYQLPVDFESYKQLRTHIAKALVPLLQIWLFPTRAVGKFEKRYGDLCELLSLRPQGAPSLIDRQLRPALDELLKMGYISNWSLSRTADNLEYKVVLFHGPKYLKDLKLLNSRSEESDAASSVEPLPELVEILVRRGMSVRAAKKLLEQLPCDQPVQAQLEWCDAIIQKGKIDNPVGFIYSVVKNNEPVPESFETTEKRTARVKKEHEDLAAYAKRLEQEQQYERYVEDAIANALSGYIAGDYENALRRFAPEIQKQYPNLPSTTIRELSEARLKQEIRGSVAIMSIEDFISQAQYPLFN